MVTIEELRRPQIQFADRIQRWTLAICLLAGSCVVFLPYGMAPAIPAEMRLPLWVAVALGFGLAALVVKFSRRYRAAWPPLFALFVASIAQLIDWQFSHWLTRILSIPIESPVGLALEKLESSALIILIILASILLTRQGLGSLYWQRGKVRWWLPIGLIALVLFLVMPLTGAQLLFGSAPLTLADILPHLHWVLLFALSNALAEELLFRGLLLPRFGPLIGQIPAILLVTLVFTFWHLGAGYASDMLLFLVIVFALGLTWAVITVKTDSIWGSVLFHAGADIPIVLAFIATM